MNLDHYRKYTSLLAEVIEKLEFEKIHTLAEALRDAWKENRQVFICGNGGSAANAMHIANDLFYGVAKGFGVGIRAHALAANQSIITCLANDISYEDIFCKQIEVMSKPGDILLILSGSGNSINIVKAIEAAKKIGMKTFAILGYSGGKCLQLVDVPIHFKVEDMQIAEDLQLIVGHMITQWLYCNGINSVTK
jgi:D-sedoheptulose 7-phosphate isomerase